MKATNDNVAVETASELNVEVQEDLLKPAEVTNIFKEINAKTDHFTEYALELVIENDETLVIAENNASDLQEILKNIETVRTIRKKPYYDASKMIDEFAKGMAKPLLQAKEKITGAITNFKRVQQASASAEAENIKKKAGELADAKALEADRIHRIQSQLNARIYGGWWMNKENQRKSSAGAIKPEDLDPVLDLVKNKIPKADTFEHMVEDYNNMIIEVTKNISEHKANLINASSESKTLKEDAMEKINQAKIKAGIKTNEAKQEMNEAIVDDAKKEIKSADKEVKAAGKGVRKTLKFEVTDFDSVPKEYLMLDETKVRAWANENKADVKQKMKDGEVIIDGLNFFLEDAFVSR